MLIKGKTLRLFIRSVFVFFIFVCALLSAFITFFSLYFGADAVFGYSDSKIQLSLTVFFAVSAAVLFLFYFLFAFCTRASYFSLSDSTLLPEESVCKFSCAVRYMKCRFCVALYRLSWALLFFLPGMVTLLFTFCEIMLSGGIIKSVFFVLICASLALLSGGGIFYFVVSSRYFLTDYLLYISPLQPVREVVASSVMLMKGKLIYVSLLRLYLIFSSVGALIPFLAPRYCALYGCMRVLVAEKIYGRRETAKKQTPVVFYINKKSVFLSP